MTTTSENQPSQPDGERADLLESLRVHRAFLRHTVTGLTEEQARRRSTVSELTLGGLVKHVSATEAGWLDFAEHGPQSPEDGASDEPDYAAQAESFRLTDDETLAGVLAAYEQVAARADALVATLDLDRAWPLPPAPWFEPGATRSVRRVFMHVVGETAQHAGHADIIREAIDGQRTMG